LVSISTHAEAMRIDHEEFFMPKRIQNPSSLAAADNYATSFRPSLSDESATFVDASSSGESTGP
jgi:hypothetical protein